VANALAVLFQPEQFNVAVLMSEDAQAHLHLLSRYTGPRHCKGRHLDDPHWGQAQAEQRILGPEDLGRLANQIRTHLVPLG